MRWIFAGLARGGGDAEAYEASTDEIRRHVMIGAFVVVGIIILFMILRAHAKRQPQQQVLPGPPCNTCGAPTDFVVQYGQAFCRRCNRYVG